MSCAPGAVDAYALILSLCFGRRGVNEIKAIESALSNNCSPADHQDEPKGQPLSQLPLGVDLEHMASEGLEQGSLPERSEVQGGDHRGEEGTSSLFRLTNRRLEDHRMFHYTHDEAGMYEDDDTGYEADYLEDPEDGEDPKDEEDDEDEDDEEWVHDYEYEDEDGDKDRGEWPMTTGQI